MITSTDNPRVINYKQYKWPVQDPIEMTVTCFFTGQPLKIKSYHYPAYYNLIKKQEGLASGMPRETKESHLKSKGIIFYTHGWSDYAGR